MAYEFFYWPEIQGRGEFVRLALEDAGAAYIDVARGLESEGRGVPAMLALMRGEGTSHIPFAPPFLRDGDIIVSHTAAILLYLGGRIGLAPTDEDGRLWTHQIQLTITDIVMEVYNSHHPIDEDKWFHEQKDEAIRACSGLPQGSNAEVPRLVRADSRGEPSGSGSPGWQFRHLCRSLLVPVGRGIAFRVSSRVRAGVGKAAARDGPAQGSGGTAALEGLFGERTPSTVPGNGYLPPLPGTGWLAARRTKCAIHRH